VSALVFGSTIGCGDAPGDPGGRGGFAGTGGFGGDAGAGGSGGFAGTPSPFLLAYLAEQERADFQDRFAG
jgi:hypothetical protein